MKRIFPILLVSFCALLLYMPFHIFLSQWIGTSVGGLEFWKVLKDVALISLFVVTGITVLLTVSRQQWSKYTKILVLVGIYFVLHVVTYLLNRQTSLEVATLATVYNNRFIWAFLIGLGLAVLKPKDFKLSQPTVIKGVLALSTVLCVLGLLQWFLPSDILTHFGYAKELGVKPNFFINEDPAFPRVFTTFRDPNSFGAYLIIPILLLVQLVQKHKKRWLFGGLLALHIIVLYLSFSRAAWLGAIIGCGALIMVMHKDKAVYAVKHYWPVLLICLCLVGFATYSIRDTPTFRSIVLKADDKNDAASLDSDEYHLHFIKEGITKVADKPLGYGPGTAGIVSIRNGDGGQLTENYYIQIAHEVGVLGLAVFVAIWALVVKILLGQKRTTLTIALLASAAAYAVMALVMHLWTNEAVAMGWWGLAGIYMITLTPQSRRKEL